MNRLIASWRHNGKDQGGPELAPTIWHFLPGEGAGKTLCECNVPPQRHMVTQTEIDTAQIGSLKGFCFTCFHCVCIELQEPELWNIFNHYDQLRDAISSLGSAIRKADGPEREKTEALTLLNDLLRNPFVESVLGGTDRLR